jgi:hypothetical protein
MKATHAGVVDFLGSIIEGSSPHLMVLPLEGNLISQDLTMEASLCISPCYGHCHGVSFDLGSS